MAITQPIPIKCTLQLMSGQSIPGITRNISMQGASIKCNSLTLPKMGDSAMFTLNIIKGNLPLAIRASCRVVNAQAGGIEIAAQFAYMAKNEVESLKTVLANKSAEIN